MTDLTTHEVSQLNDLSIFLSYQMSDIDRKFLHLPHKIIGLFSGNQKGKTCVAMYSTVLSIMGRHPVVEKNFDYYKCLCGEKWNATRRPKTGKCKCGGDIKLYCNSVRTARLASETLPGETTDQKGDTSTEVKNTLYPELKKWLPPFLIKKDITARSPKMVIKSGVGGPEIVIDFVSYNQSVQSTAGSQRFIIKCDEEPPKAFWDEQLPRLLAADGWLEISLTPANYISWCHDEIFDRASVYHRSKIVADKFYGGKELEIIRDDNQIAVIQAATDDNPTLRPEVIERLFENYDDEDTIAIRRYGIFKQVSGRIFKDFDRIHIIDEHTWFPDGINMDWFHARGLDYHGRNPWAVGWVALSDTDELFVYDEYNPSPEHNTTDAIASEIVSKSKDYRYKLNLVDPLIKASQIKPNWTVLDDMNDCFLRLKKAGVGTGGNWEVWDTKSERGRDNIKIRLKNSIICGKPFNNSQTKDGKTVTLPTIWIFSRCKNFINSFKNWRYEEWANTGANHAKEDKNNPQQKWSHFPIVIEGLLKDFRFRALHKRPGYMSRDFKDDRFFRSHA